MITIVNSKTLMDMLPPLDEDTALQLRINQRCAEFEVWFNKFAMYLGAFAILYIIIRCYQQ